MFAAALILQHYLLAYLCSVMTATQSFKIYELLNAQFQQPEKAKELTEAIEAVIDEKVQAGTRQFESSFKKDLEILRSDIRTEMREQKVDLIKWFVSLFIALALMIIGLYVKM